jgi:hypothetical protein
MVNKLRILIKQIDDATANLRSCKGRQVYKTNSGIISPIRNLVDFYFRDTRDSLTSNSLKTEAISALDSSMQELLSATHRNTTVQVYKERMKMAHESSLKAEQAALTCNSQPARNKDDFDRVDSAIIETLKKLVPSASNSYEQGLIDAKMSSRLSWRGPATDFRESLRECLDHLAPDKDVMAQPGFKVELDAKGPTMRQKAKFILDKRGISKSQQKTTEDTINTIEASMSSLVRSVYSRASFSTHTPTSRDEVVRIRNLVRVVLLEILSIVE